MVSMINKFINNWWCDCTKLSEWFPHEQKLRTTTTKALPKTKQQQNPKYFHFWVIFSTIQILDIKT